jgi:hypothetical protein
LKIPRFTRGIFASRAANPKIGFELNNVAKLDELLRVDGD